MIARDPEVSLADVLREVRRIQVQSKRLVTGFMAGGYSSVFRGSGIEFDEVREYVEGDDPRSVDWNVTARVGRPFVKKYKDERDLTVLFVLDLSPSMSAGFGAWSARETAARICACLALSAVRNNDRIGLIAFSSRVDKHVPAQKGIGHALRVVRDCLALPSGDGPTDLGVALELATRVVRRHSVVFVMSDFLGDGWERPISLCARRHDVIAVRLLPPELRSLEAGLLHVRDPETGEALWLDASNAQVRKAFEERVQAWSSRVQSALIRARVDRMDVPIPKQPDGEAAARPILRFFRMRELRGMKR
ncbi:MAG: DUF58 domain-containing protein [Planctomycetota bacterium]